MSDPAKLATSPRFRLRSRAEAQAHQILLALRNRVEAGTHDPGYGICSNIQPLVEAGQRIVGADFKTADDYISDLMLKWPEHSGNSGYPVEGYDAYVAASKNLTVWDGENGQKRRRLLNWLIEETAP